MKLTNWQDALKSAKLDESVGISIAPLTSEQHEFCFYITRIQPNKKVNAHYHQHGVEIYGIFKGQGTLFISKDCNDSNATNLIHTHLVTEGDFFNIEPKTVHQLVNTGETDLILLFGCAPSHLTTDRVLAQDMS